jgi:hypothetical protein
MSIGKFRKVGDKLITFGRYEQVSALENLLKINMVKARNETTATSYLFYNFTACMIVLLLNLKTIILTKIQMSLPNTIRIK